MIFALLLLLTTAGDVAPRPPEIHALLVDSEGRVRPAPIPFEEKALRAATEVWAWSEDLPPRRFASSSAEFSRFVATPREELQRCARKSLKIQVGPSLSKRQLATLQVIAAPVIMWQDIPESLLPRYAVDDAGTASVPYCEGALRIRLIGDRLGSRWQDIQGSARTVRVDVTRASTMEVAVEGEDGSEIGDASATLFRAREGRSAPTVEAQLQSNSHGVFVLQSVPEDETVRMMAVARGYAPASASGAPGELTRIRLSRGTRLVGSFREGEGKPVGEVNVVVESWAGAAAVMRRECKSDASGVWLLDNLASGDLILRTSRKGFAAVSQTIAVTGDTFDLGVIRLEKAVTLNIAVNDTDDQPVANASVSVDGVAYGKTDRAGVLKLEGLSPSGSVKVEVRAKGYENTTLKFSPPFRKSELMILKHVFAVSGVVVDEQHHTVDGVLVKVQVGTKYQTVAVGADGQFEIPVDPDFAFQLTFDSPSFASVTRSETAGRPGEVRDLGEVRLDRGLVVRGRLMSGQMPVAGARVWALRPAADGAIAAWLTNRTSEARTREDGSFELRGLAAGAALIRFDAPGFARVYRQIASVDAVTDVGDVEITRGATVRVTTEFDDPGEAVARIDLQGRGLDFDMLDAPIVDGTARIRHVPSGKFTITVVRGNAVECEQTVTLLNDGTDADVQCSGAMKVRGVVRVGDNTAPGGTLSWRASGAQEVQSVIINKQSPLGARRQDVYGLGAGHITTPVMQDGRFLSNRLRAGAWQVVWTSSDLAVSEAQSIVVPDVREADITIQFGGSLLKGVVVDDAGDAVGGARVTVLNGTAVAMSGPDGTFALLGLAEGLHQLQATLGDRSSRASEVSIVRGRPGPTVTLVLNQRDENTLEITVQGTAGQPVSNAFIFVDAGGVSRIVSADGAGVGRVSFASGIPQNLRLVAYAATSWAFGELRGCDDASKCRTTIRMVETGRLSVTSTKDSGVPVVVAPTGAQISLMLSRLGSPLALVPGTPLIIAGLPPGTYEVSLGTNRKVATVKAREAVSLSFP